MAQQQGTPPPEQTVEDLGKLVKQKYPQYSKVPDAEVGTRVKQKYPQAYGNFKDLSTKSGPPSMFPSAPQPPPEPGRSVREDWPTSSEWKGIATEALPAVGTGVAAMFVPEITIPGMALMAAGGAAGRLAETGIKKSVGTDALSGPVYKADKPPSGAGDILSDAVYEGGKQLLYELGGRAVGSAVRGVIGGPLHSAASKPENEAVAAISKKYGLRLTAPQIAGSTGAGRVSRLVQRLGEYSLLSQGYISGVREEGVQAGVKAIDDVLSHLAPPTSPMEAGESAQKAFKISNDLFKETAGKFYSALDKESQGVMVNMEPVKKAAQDILNKYAPVKATFPGTGGVGSGSQKLLEDAAKSPYWVPFRVAHDWRTKLMSVTPQSSELMANEAQGIAKNLVGVVTDTMDTSASAFNPKAKKIWDVARNFYKNGAQLFDSATISGLMDKDPEYLVGAIKNGGESTARRIKSAILDYPVKYGNRAVRQEAQETWKEFQEQFVRSSIVGFPEQGMAGRTIEDLANIKDRISSMGPKVLNAMFDDPEGKETLANIKAIGDAFSRVKKLPTEGRMWMYEMLRASAGFATAGVSAHGVEVGSGVEGAVAFETFPVLISAAAYSKKATGYLVDGIGGLLESFDTKPVKAIGKGIIKVQGKLVSSKAVDDYGGRVMGNLGRAWEESNKVKEKLRKPTPPPGPAPQKEESKGPPDVNLFKNPY